MYVIESCGRSLGCRCYNNLRGLSFERMNNGKKCLIYIEEMLVFKKI